MLDWPLPLLLLVGIGGSFLLILAMVPFLLWFTRRSRRASAPPAPPPIPAEVLATITRLDEIDTADAAIEELVARGVEVVPHLLVAVSMGEHGPHAEARLFGVLARIGDPRAFQRLAAMVRRSAPGWRAALPALVSFGTDDASRLALEVLDGYESSHSGRSPPLPCHHVYEGVVNAAGWRRVTPAFRDALFLPIVRRVGERWPQVRPNAADAALSLDPEAAALLLTAPEVLDRGADAVGAALAALDDAGRAIDPALAASLATALPVRAATTNSQLFTLSTVLRAVARSGHPGARELIEPFLRVVDEATQDVARDALAVLDGTEREAPEMEAPPETEA